MITRLSAAIVAISLLAGNIVGQTKYPRPPVPDAFRGADASVPDQTSIGDQKWFEIFKDPELQKLVRTAIVQNYVVRLAIARINAARANLGLARSDQFPQFVASADVTTTRVSQNGQAGPIGPGGRTRSVGNVFLNLLSFE